MMLFMMTGGRRMAYQRGDMAYQRGDVVLIPFPYTDLSAQKTRPAIVVSSQHFHTVRSELLLMYVSSQVDKADPAIDYLLQDWQDTRLLKLSLARPKIAAVEPSLVVYKVGTLSERDLLGVDQCLLRAFGLESALLSKINLTAQSAAFVQAMAESILAVAIARKDEAGINLNSLQTLLEQESS